MNYVPFGSTGLMLSEISLGGMQVNCSPGFKGAEEGDEPLAIRAVQTAVGDCGVNLIDTARWYKRSQEIIGRALAEMSGGEKVHIATKVSPDTDEARVIDQVEVCLRDLRRDHVDVMQIHSGTDHVKRDATLPVLQRLRDKGLFRFIGVTMGYGREVPGQAMACIRSGDYDAIQLHINALHPVFAREVLPAAKAAGMASLAMNPQCGGYLAKRCPDATRYDLSFLADLGVTRPSPAASGPSTFATTAQSRTAGICRLTRCAASSNCWPALSTPATTGIGTESRNGEGGIRTRGTLASTQHFQCCSFGHSDTSPGTGRSAGGRTI
jgi:aryl-alcohol dehydrogenase-like predicted oxidoreductase